MSSKDQPPVLGLTRQDRPRAYNVWYPPAPPLTLTSVTTVLDVLSKPALQRWYANIAAGWVADNVELVLKMLADFGRDATVKAIASRGEAERDRKAKIGTDAHKAVENLLAGLPVLTTADTAPLVDQYQRFTRDWSFTPIWSEAMVCSLQHGYAGTFDLYGVIAGKRALIDIKTGSFIAPEMGIQLAGYANADFIGRPGTIDRWRLPPVDVYLILQLQPTEYRLIPFSVGAAEQAAFLAALAVARWIRAEGRKIIGQPLTEGMLQIA